MQEFLNKLSSYNFLNYLLPGVIFSALASSLTKYSLAQKDILIGVFVYYFIGLVTSRIGSLIVEPFLKKVSFVRFANYKDFVAASKNDEKIEILSEANNTYRTLSAMLLMLLLLKIFEYFAKKYPILDQWSLIVLLVSLLIMFLFSYRKQTNYITERIDQAK